MNKLLRSNFSRLWKSRIFWNCMIAMSGYVIVYMLYWCRLAAADLSEYSYSMDECYFHFALSIGFFCALLCSMFFGTEVSDGTIRNKVIVGHTRANIYLASLITTFTATFLILSVWLIGALVAVPTLGFWKMGIPRLLLFLLISVMFILVYSALFTAICMLSSNKALTVLVSILLFLGLLVFASVIYNGLKEPEMINGIQITQNGIEMAESSPNPNYITGVKRDIYSFLVDFLPTGQGIRLWQLEVTHPIRMLVSSLFWTVAVTAGGLSAFKKKDLK